MLVASLLALYCGSERTPVKDALDGARLHRAGLTTVEKLAALPRPTWHDRAPRTKDEAQIVEVVVTVLRWHKEADQDWHLVVAGDSGRTMIAEIPSPECAARSPYAKLIAKARAEFTRLYRPGAKLRIAGAVFLDHPHRQDGRAANDVELHPVLGVAAP